MFGVCRCWLLIAACAIACAPTGCYELQQGFGEIDMLSRRRSIAEALRDPGLDPTTRDRLETVLRARRFAQSVLGLHASESFQDVVWLGRDAASYVVSAAPADRLEEHRWCFPIAGCLPYIGYFDRRNAEREAASFRAQGYDVAIRGVSAYSLGGWLPDPVYSPLLDDSREWIANTVIHELTHGTVFVPGHAAFNESFATFVGDRGSIEYLSRRYGPHSATVRDAQDELRDHELLSTELNALRVELRSIYASNASRADKLQQKHDAIERARSRIRALPFRVLDAARVASRPINNATLATHATYFGGSEDFERAYRRLGNDLPRLIRFVHDRVAREDDPDAFLARWVRSSSPP
jgi:predicted aminopeptidase